MRKTVVGVVLAVVVLLVSLGDAEAWSGGRHGHGGFRGWNGPNVVLGVAPFFPFYSYPPVPPCWPYVCERPTTMPIVVMPPQPAVQKEPVWYYCRILNEYYPQRSWCPEAWEEVPMKPSGRSVRMKTSPSPAHTAQMSSPPPAHMKWEQYCEAGGKIIEPMPDNCAAWKWKPKWERPLPPPPPIR